ncbi:MAG: dihydroorotase [Candidatus Gracilibacteria bacterium]|jgi:dihydroorotase
MAKILLKNGLVVSGAGVSEKDVLVDGGKIAEIVRRGNVKIGKDVKVIDCDGKMILPGLIDAHVHFRTPGFEYKEDWTTGSKAALHSGVTTVLDMPNNDPPVTGEVGLAKKRDVIKGKSFVNYGLFVGYTGDNVDWINKTKNVAGVKVYMAHSTGKMGVEHFEDVFKKCEKLIVVHAEDQRIISENEKKYLAEYYGREVDVSVHSKIHSVEAAVKSVEQACKLAEKYSHDLHVAHVSSDEEIEIIKKYKEKSGGKYRISCEVAPHSLLLSDDDYEVLGNLIKINPAVRERSEIFSVWKALKFGDIDMIATDHAPHTLEEKKQSYVKVPSGVPELDTLLPILLNAVNDEGLTIEEVVILCCEKPSKIFGLNGKGLIKEGFDADLVVVDMEKEWTVNKKNLFTKCGWSPYEGSVFKGAADMVFVSGNMAFEKGKPVKTSYGKEVLF